MSAECPHLPRPSPRPCPRPCSPTPRQASGHGGLGCGVELSAPTCVFLYPVAANCTCVHSPPSPQLASGPSRFREGPLVGGLAGQVQGTGKGKPARHGATHRMVSFMGRQPCPPCVTFRLVVAPLRGPGRSPVLPFACCVGSLLSVGRCGRCSCWCRFPPPPPPCLRHRWLSTGPPIPSPGAQPSRTA